MAAERSKTANQLSDFAKSKKVIAFNSLNPKPAPQTLYLYVQVPEPLTTSHGQPIDCKTATLTAGKKGPVLLQDHTFLDEMAHFDRERIPERVVHAKGAGNHDD